MSCVHLAFSTMVLLTGSYMRLWVIQAVSGMYSERNCDE